MSDPAPEPNKDHEDSQCDCSDCAESSSEEEEQSGESSPRLGGEASGSGESGSESNSEYTPGSSRASSKASSRGPSPPRTSQGTKASKSRQGGGRGKAQKQSQAGQGISAETADLLTEAAKLLEKHKGGGDRNPRAGSSIEEIDLNQDMGTHPDQNQEGLDVPLPPQDEPQVQTEPEPEPCRDYEVEAILAKRIYKYKVQYWIKWEDHPDSANSWEPEEHLTNCPELLAEFNKKWLEEKQNRNKAGPGRGYTKAMLQIGRKRAKNPDSDSDEEEAGQKDKTGAAPPPQKMPGSVPIRPPNPEPEPDPEDLL